MITATPRVVTLERDVCSYVASTTTSPTLSNLNLKVLRNYEIIKLGDSQTMYYRHQMHEVAQVIGETPDRFVILSDLGENLWRPFAANPNPSPDRVGCRLYRVDDSMLENSPGLYAEVWDVLGQQSKLSGPEGILIHAVVAKSSHEATRAMNKYQEEKGIFEIAAWD